MEHKESCILTLAESDAIVAQLLELPLKYGQIVRPILDFLQKKFTEDAEKK